MLQTLKNHHLLSPLTKRIFHSVLFITLISLGEASLAYFVPNHIMNVFNSSLLLGIIMAVSSLVGLVADLTIPQLLPNLTTKKSLSLTLFFQVLFVLSLIVTMLVPSIVVFILAMGFWGIYYEFLSFTGKTFVAARVPHSHHSLAWANIMFGKSFAYIAGPIIVSFLLVSGEWPVLRAILGLTLGIQLLLMLFPPKDKNGLPEDEQNQPKTLPKIGLELTHWKALAKHAWPAIALIFVFGLIDASFWTIGSVLSEKLHPVFDYAYLIIPAYLLPAILAQLILMKKAVVNHKEKFGAIFLIIGSGAVVFFGFANPGISLLLFSFMIGFFNSLAFNLAEATFSDLEERMGIHKQHLIGLSSSAYSISYIVGPLLAGLLASRWHEQFSFSFIGGLGIGISLLVLFLSPKRMSVPQKEILSWIEDGPSNKN